jgi:glycosyltransferase involved in cell wall biosynthesis
MNIAFFTDTYFPQMNGVVISIDHFVKKLRKMGHTVYIFAPLIEGYTDRDPHVIRLKSITALKTKPAILFPLLLPDQNYKQMFSLPIDIIHAHGNGAFSLLGYQVAHMRRIPFLLTFHTMFTQYLHYIKGVISPNVIEQTMKVFGNICDSVITPSIKMKKELLRYGVKKPIYVVPNFIHFSQFDHQKKSFLHKKYAIAEKTPILLSVGRLGREKNFDFIITMFTNLIKIRPEVHLVLIGYGPEEERLKEKIQKVGIADKVTITGMLDREDIPKSYADSDVFVFASKSETQGIIVLEAAAAGLPVVIVKDAAYTNMIEDGKSGYETALSSKLFIEKILYLLDHPEKRKAFGEYGKQLVREKFDEEVLTERLFAVYTDTLTQFKLKQPMVVRLQKQTFERLTQTANAVRDFFQE